MTVSEKMKGNDNAEKWTLEKTNELFDKILEQVKSDKKCRSISEAALEVGEYEGLVLYLEKKFSDTVFLSIKKAREIVKNRLVNQGLDGDANSTMAIFILKNNHGFRDKIETENTNKNENYNHEVPVIKFVDTDSDNE